MHLNIYLGSEIKYIFEEMRNEKKKRTKKKKNPATSSSRKEVNLEVILKIFLLFLKKFQIRSVSSVTMLQPFLNGAILN